MSSDELELTENGGTNLICKYSKEGNTIRAVTNILGSNQAIYFQITEDGLRSKDGALYLSEKMVRATAAPKMKQFAADELANPTRMVAGTMVTVSGGQMELIAEDDANKRYTVRAKPDGKLTTVYWSKKKNAPEIIQGDFSAVPAEDAGAAEPAPSAEPK